MVGPEFGTTHVVYYLLKRGAKEEDEQISESPTVEACFVDEYTAPIAGAVSLLADHRITVPIVDDSGRPRGQGTFDQIVLRPDGMELVAAGSNARVACSSDGTLLWGHNDHADTVALTADGERCLFASGNKVAICDSATGKLLGECELKDQPTRGRTDPMFEQCMIEAGTVQFTVDGKLALAGTRVQSRDNKDRELRERDFRVRIYATARGNETRRFPSTHTAPITCLALSPDGKKLLTGSQDHTVRLWDIARATELRVYRSRAPVHGLCWSADGLRFAAASGEIDHKLWDELQRKKAPIDASRIDCAVRVWDATSGDELCRLGDLPWIPERIALSSDGRVVAAENRIWEVDTGQLRFYVPGSGSPAGFTPDDRRLITVGQGVSFWRLP
jgi:WD40 repeat protein